jgi:hypothetical protein
VSAFDVETRFEDASECLAEVSDIVRERASEAEPPSWCVRRGWVAALAALSDDQVDAIERDGLASFLAEGHAKEIAPADLRELAARVRFVTSLPRLANVETHEHAVDGRRASPRKRVQVASFAAAVERVAGRVDRIVDLGSGHGHLTRHLAVELGVPAEGWERDAARVRVAESLVGSDVSARFVVVDASLSSSALGPRDLVVGLHACGALGDHAIRSAGEARASVALVGCCPQKCSGARVALSASARVGGERLVLPHEALGLANVRDGETRVETDRSTGVRSRAHRLALRRLLRARGPRIDPGEEMRGINRRRAEGDFPSLVAAAFAQRGLEMPSPGDVVRAEADAHDEHRRIRRWELPRTLLARLLEVWIALDRATYLLRLGYRVRVAELFANEVSPRNLLVLGTPREHDDAIS